MNVTSRQKDLTSQHKDLTRRQNHMTAGDRNMPPYCLEVTPLDIWSLTLHLSITRFWKFRILELQPALAIIEHLDDNVVRLQ